MESRKSFIGGKCRNGHDLTPENVRIRKDRRNCIECLTCQAAGMRRFKNKRPLYDIWKKMIQRCYDPTFKDWNIYGGRPGNPVTVCERWMLSYEDFESDMGRRPSMQHTIDRIDGTKGYEPGNVKWSTATEQARNTSTNVFIEHRGLRLTIAEWAERYGFKYDTLFQRLNRGWSVETSLTTPTGTVWGGPDQDPITKRFLPGPKKVAD